MEPENSTRNPSVYSQKVKAGRKRTYFIDVMQTRGNDFYITLTESTRRNDGIGYSRHQIFLYKEDFNRFAEALLDVVNHIKTDLMPEFDYDQFAHRDHLDHGEEQHNGKGNEDQDHISW